LAELATLNNCLNEALILVDKTEFPTRVGADKAGVERLLDEINDAFNENWTKANLRVSRQNDQFDILVSRDELKILANCTREALSRLRKDSFKSRVGRKLTSSADICGK
jgi:hypothetical protein